MGIIESVNNRRNSTSTAKKTVDNSGSALASNTGRNRSNDAKKAARRRPAFRQIRRYGKCQSVVLRYSMTAARTD